MNRRNFFKTVTGFAAGLCAVVLPSKVIGKKRSGTQLATEMEIEKFNRLCYYLPIEEYENNPNLTPYDTHIYPSFDRTGKLKAFYWKVSEIGRATKIP